VQSLSGAPVGSSNRLTFAYDPRGRRISRVVEAFTSGAWTITLSNRFVYDDWKLLAELNATNNAPINSFMWVLDLIGSPQGGGGVGGLLAITTTNAGTHFVGYDGSGNVALLVSATSGAATADYEYDPFGNVLRATGQLAVLNPFRFSTKFQDNETGLLYYGHRYYAPSIGRWASRDPSGEHRGSLYVIANNNTMSFYDYRGLGHFQFDTKYEFHHEFTEFIYTTQGWLPVGGQVRELSVEVDDHDWDLTKPGVAHIKNTKYKVQTEILIASSYEDSLIREWTLGEGFMSVWQHEQNHNEIYRRYHMASFSIYSMLDGKTVCKPCFFAFKAFADSANTMIMTQMRRAQYEYDWTAYGNLAAFGALEGLDASLPPLRQDAAAKMLQFTITCGISAFLP
jgi:RHS repeat-associated protein